MRIKIIRFIIAVGFLMISGTLIYFQVFQGKYYSDLSKNNRIRVVPLEGWRGEIKDRYGNLLAQNKISYNVMVTPQDIKDSDVLFEFLSTTLGVGKKNLLRRYSQQKFTPFAPVIVADNITRAQAIILEENKYRFPSLIIEEGFQRYYPQGKEFAHILGYVGKMNRSMIEKFKDYGYPLQSIVGYSGIEEYYDTYLKGTSGGIQIEVNSRGKQVRLLGYKETSAGQDISITIDSGIQEIASDVFDGIPGALVMMDINNGEILSLISSPAYDPNIFVDENLNWKTSEIFNDKNSPMLNRAVRGSYPPGSVFKIPVALAALDTNKINENTTIISEGFYDLGGIRFGCTAPPGSYNLIKSISMSCNVFFYKVGRMLGSESIKKYAMMLGLGDRTNIDLPYENKGYIPSKRHGFISTGRRWFEGDTLNLSIGQGDVLATPLQLTLMMSTIAREGVQVQPHLIYSIGGLIVDKYQTFNELSIKPKIFELIQKGLRSAVADYAGTAHVLDFKEFKVYGKTGTAQTNRDKPHHAWFAGYVKGGKKDFSFCIFLEHGGSSHNATILARQLLTRMQQKNLL